VILGSTAGFRPALAVLAGAAAVVALALHARVATPLREAALSN
jgi:hypothetical protein